MLAGTIRTLEDEKVECSNMTKRIAKHILCDHNQLPWTSSSDLRSCEVFHPVEVEGGDESVPHWRISVHQGAPLYQPQNVIGAIRQQVSGHSEEPVQLLPQRPQAVLHRCT